MEHQQERRATDLVEWLAALWQLTEPVEPRCANPHLLTLLQFTPEIVDHPAFDLVNRRRLGASRDRLLKEVVCAAYGETPREPALVAALQAFCGAAAGLLGPGPDEVIRDARDAARQRVAEIAGDLDPAADLAAATGERLALRVVLSPSVFLPPPQAGRHGVLLRQGDGWVVHLCFGFPLLQDPQQFSITRPWLLGGAWHYAIHLYLERHWPPVAARLADNPALAEALAAALAEPADRPRDGAGVPWTEVVRAHVNVAMKCLLARRLGLPDGVHRAFARARGLTLFPWFEEWLMESEGAEGTALAGHIAALPEALAAAQPRWQSLARAAAGPPPTVNLALISPGARRGCLVVPDAWPEEEATAAVAGWRLLPLPLVRYGEWAHTRRHGGDPVIAFGPPEHNPLVERVLEQRGLSLPAVAAVAVGSPAIIALSTPGFDEAPWCIAVAVADPAAAAALRMEMALKQTSTWVLFDGGTVLDAGRVPLDQLGAAAPLPRGG